MRKKGITVVVFFGVLAWMTSGGAAQTTAEYKDLLDETKKAVNDLAAKAVNGSLQYVLDETVTPMNSIFVTQLKQGVGFASASGHVQPADINHLLPPTLPDIVGPTWFKMGIGASVSFTEIDTKALAKNLNSMLSSLGDSGNVSTSSLEQQLSGIQFLWPIALAPQINVKLGVLPALKWDIGLRVGVMPSIPFSVPIDANNSAKVTFGWGLIGAQFRAHLWRFGPLYACYGGSLDVFFGGYKFELSGAYKTTQTFSGADLPGYSDDIKTDLNLNYDLTVDNNWQNMAITPFILAGANLIVIKPYIGLGMNIDLGHVASTTAIKGTAKATALNEEILNIPIEPKPAVAEDMVQFGNLRFIVGSTFLFISATLEADILFKSWSVTSNLININF